MVKNSHMAKITSGDVTQGFPEKCGPEACAVRESRLRNFGKVGRDPRRPKSGEEAPPFRSPPHRIHPYQASTRSWHFSRSPSFGRLPMQFVRMKTFRIFSLVVGLAMAGCTAGGHFNSG